MPPIFFDRAYFVHLLKCLVAHISLLAIVVAAAFYCNDQREILLERFISKLEKKQEKENFLSLPGS